MNTSTVTIERADLHRIASAMNVAILAAEKAADHSAKGNDVEGDIADLGLHLREISQKVDRITG